MSTTYLNRGLGFKGKAEKLVADHGAVIVHPAHVSVFIKVGPVKDSRDVLVCVVDNGPFEAAAVVDDQRDYDGFSDTSDLRRKTWLLMPRVNLAFFSGTEETHPQQVKF